MITKLGYFSLEKRNLMILFFIFFIPTLFLSYFSFRIFFTYKQLETEIESIESLAPFCAEQRKKRFDFLTNHIDTNPNYLQELIFSTKLLCKEREMFHKLDAYKIFQEDLDFQKRRKFVLLENKLSFQKDEEKRKSKIQETRYFLKQKAEADLKDVEHLLFNLELKKNTPQYLIYDFQMDLTNQNTYILNLLILQREFLK